MTIKVAAVQAAPVAFDLSKSLDELDKWISQASRNDARLVVLPEAFLCGYPRGLDFVIGSRTPESRQWYGRYVRVSVRCAMWITSTG
jgi:nitrilase